MNRTEYIRATTADIDILVEFRILFMNELFGAQPPEVEAALRTFTPNPNSEEWAFQKISLSGCWKMQGKGE